jgi:hypothetical protein
MNIQQILDGIHAVVAKAYAGAEPADRLAFECGMLTSALREMSCLLDNAVDRCKQLEIELMHKENI